VSLSWGRPTPTTSWPAGTAPGSRPGARAPAGELAPNEIINPGNELVTQVPDRPLRHWFLRADDPAEAGELRALVRRLPRMDVKGYRLQKPLTVPDYKAYGRAPRVARLPAGTSWVPMAQAQKH
jgi:hypothetical protein